MDKSPLVSIVINAFNAEKYLNETIDSVFSQTYTNWEIIFWDNKSTDSTKNIIKNYDDKRIKYFLASKFTELGEARNMAISRSSGEFIAFLDSDDIWMPRKLEKQIPLFRNKNVGLVYSNSKFLVNNKDKGSIFDNVDPIRGSCFRKLLFNYPISLEAAVVRKKAMDGLNKLFDERFTGIEEYDLFCRISENWEIDYVDEPLSKWRVHENSWTHKNSEKFMEERDLMYSDMLARNDIEKIYPGITQELNEYEYHNKMMWYWRNGKAAVARRHLLKSGKSKLKFILFYLMTFIPAKPFEKLIVTFSLVKKR